jgi:cytochrome c oxidase accessory protein FixG
MKPQDPTHFRDRIATVDAKGGRVWVHPKRVKGRFMNRRTALSWVLLAFLFAGPWLRIGGEPLLLLNIVERKFVLLGQVFWPQDGFLFALAMITFFVAVIVFTVVYGRIFCGWICPQTVFLEFVFRPIERWLEGDRAARMRRDAGPWDADKMLRKGAKWAIYFAVSFAIANTFLAYLIGSEELLRIQLEPPAEHLSGLGALLAFTTVFFWVFARLREQVCTTICPYGRLQGVLVDADTLNVTYDRVRGEPRRPLRAAGAEVGSGDCVDCGLCVQVCPTGIDIRNGLQLECVHCTACIDACDGVMDKVKRPRGLIRYASENSIARGEPFRWTTRAKAYSAVLIVLLGVLGGLIFMRDAVQMNIYRTAGMVYQVDDAGEVSNLYRFTLLNKTRDSLLVEIWPEDERFRVEPVGERVAADASGHGGGLWVAPEEMTEGVFFLKASGATLAAAKNKVRLVCSQGDRVVARATTEFPGPIPSSGN